MDAPIEDGIFTEAVGGEHGGSGDGEEKDDKSEDFSDGEARKTMTAFAGGATVGVGGKDGKDESHGG